MADIMLILKCLSQSVDKTSLGRLVCLVEGLLAMTMRGLALDRARGQLPHTAVVFQYHAELGSAALAVESPAPAGW